MIFYDDTPVRYLGTAVLDGERCVMIEWPNGDRGWVLAGYVATRPKTER